MQTIMLDAVSVPLTIAKFVLQRGLVVGGPAESDGERLQADIDAGRVSLTDDWDMWSDLSPINKPDLWDAASEVERIAILCNHFGVNPFACAL